MMRLVIVCAALMAPQDPAASPAGGEAPKPAAETEARALAKYNQMRDRTPMSVAAQSRLAAWCEQNGLKAESTVHLANVVRLDPARDRLAQARVQEARRPLDD